MENWETIVNKLISLMGFSDYKIEINEPEKRGSIFIRDHYEFVKTILPDFVKSLNHLFQLIAQKNNCPSIHLDINNYRHQREGLITELARAAAKKASVTNQEVTLPTMNAYERRLIHLELATHPEVTTESAGQEPKRFVVIKPINSDPAPNSSG